MKRTLAFTLVLILLLSTTALADSGQSQSPSVKLTHDSDVPYMSYVYWQGDIMRYNLHFPSGTGEYYAVGLVAAGTPIESLYEANGDIKSELFLYAAKNSYDFISLDTSNVVPGDYRFVYICPLVSGGTVRPAFAFYDVTVKAREEAASWALDEVGKAKNHYLVPAALANRYTSPITRDHFVLLINSLFLSKTAEAGAGQGVGLVDFAARKNLSVYDCPFEDINNRYFADTAHNYVVAANKLGIINGKSATSFDPNGLLTRQEAATILRRTAQALGVDASFAATSYQDNSLISDWASEGVGYVTSKGVMSGVGDNSFDPLGNYTYQQAYLTVYRMLKAMEGQKADSGASEPEGAALAMSVPFMAAEKEFTIKKAGVDNSLRDKALSIKDGEALFAVTFVETDQERLGYSDLLVVYRQAYLLAPDGTKYYSTYEDPWSVYVDRVVGYSVPENIDVSSLVFVIAGQSRRLDG